MVRPNGPQSPVYQVINFQSPPMIKAKEKKQTSVVVVAFSFFFSGFGSRIIFYDPKTRLKKIWVTYILDLVCFWIT